MTENHVIDAASAACRALADAAEELVLLVDRGQLLAYYDALPISKEVDR